jgi:predicted HicB family RNase H-like nuclease
MERKKLTDSLHTKKNETKKDISKEDLIIQKLEGKSATLKKLTVLIPEDLHTKLKIKAATKGLKIRDLIIEYLEQM